MFSLSPSPSHSQRPRHLSCSVSQNMIFLRDRERTSESQHEHLSCSLSRARTHMCAISFCALSFCFSPPLLLVLTIHTESTEQNFNGASVVSRGALNITRGSLHAAIRRALYNTRGTPLIVTRAALNFRGLGSFHVATRSALNVARSALNVTRSALNVTRNTPPNRTRAVPNVTTGALQFTTQNYDVARGAPDSTRAGCNVTARDRHVAKSASNGFSTTRPWRRRVARVFLG